VAGRSVIPDEVKLAALVIIKGLWDTQRGASGLPMQGGPEELMNQPGMGLYMWRAGLLLAPHRQPAGVA
jgi:hypothetical protein